MSCKGPCIDSEPQQREEKAHVIALVCRWRIASWINMRGPSSELLGPSPGWGPRALPWGLPGLNSGLRALGPSAMSCDARRIDVEPSAKKGGTVALVLFVAGVSLAGLTCVGLAANC